MYKFNLKHQTHTVSLRHTVKEFKLQHVGRRGLPGRDGTGDKHYEQDFSTATSVTVNHNLGKKPAVTVIDSASTEVIGDVNHINDNQLTVSFAAAFGGKVICN